MNRKPMSYEEWCEKMCVYEWDNDDAFVFFNCKAEDADYVLRYMKEVYCADEVDYGNIYKVYVRYQKANEDDRDGSEDGYMWKECEKGRGAVKSLVYYTEGKGS